MNKHWSRAPNIVWEEVGGRALVVHAQTGARWMLDASATQVWKLCEGCRSLADLARSLSLSQDEVKRVCEEFKRLGLMTDTPKAIPIPIDASANFKSAHSGFKALGLGAGPRRRPTPRGVSGPG